MPLLSIPAFLWSNSFSPGNKNVIPPPAGPLSQFSRVPSFSAMSPSDSGNFFQNTLVLAAFLVISSYSVCRYQFYEWPFVSRVAGTDLSPGSSFFSSFSFSKPSHVLFVSAAFQFSRDLKNTLPPPRLTHSLYAFFFRFFLRSNFPLVPRHREDALLNASGFSLLVFLVEI